MENKIITFLKNKKVAILGLGIEGTSTYNYIRKYDKDLNLFILDKNTTIVNNDIFKNDNHIELIVGEAYLKDLDKYDVIIKSPGISLNNMDITSFKNKITSQLELVLKYNNSFKIGITGSKGKSTTTSLIYQILKDQNKDVYLMGNIGLPLLDFIDETTDDSILVIEMAALQLEYVDTSPNIGIILNLFEEHLDHFKTLDNYYNAKLNILRYQSSKDYGIYVLDSKNLKELVPKLKLKSHLFTVVTSEEDSKVNIKEDFVCINEKNVYNINDERQLLGMHNLTNIMVSLAVSDILNLDSAKTSKTISAFKPLEHRMEKVGTFDDITYYDDAIATIPEATINCIEALTNVDTLIFGGMDRGIDYSNLVNYLSNSSIRNIICLPLTGHKLSSKISQKKVYLVDTMEEAVALAKKVTQKGTNCVLSPAAPSYGYFKNFKEKGNLFKELVRKED